MLTDTATNQRIRTINCRFPDCERVPDFPKMIVISFHSYTDLIVTPIVPTIRLLVLGHVFKTAHFYLRLPKSTIVDILVQKPIPSV
jgi:hypothetical protein